MSATPMRVLQVNHGYPERYNAGSEVYTRHLARALARAGHDVSVFAREEDPYRRDHVVREERDGTLPVHLVNAPRNQQRWQDCGVDSAFADVLGHVRPEVVHFHHLNHLSLGLPAIAAHAGCGVAFTIHDFWLVCPRGQLIQWRIGGEPWPLCSGQSDRRCAESCYARCHTGDPARAASDVAYWTQWVSSRMTAVEAMLEHIDAFLCPSSTVASALVARFPAVRDRTSQLDYGFPPLRMARRRRQRIPTFGYIGTHTAPKGIDLLIRAFRQVDAEARLRIWGRPRAQETESLRRMAGDDRRITFEGEYANDDAAGILAGLDAIVVPSIWLENSPLVIHEAQQARVCVITADAGGMAEYVRDGENGLLFRHREAGDLASKLRLVIEDRKLASRLGSRGYLHHPRGEVISIDSQAAELTVLYRSLAQGCRYVA